MNDHSIIHLARTVMYSALLCCKLKVSKQDSVYVMIASLLHDLGRTNNTNDTKHDDNINYEFYGIQINDTIKQIISLHCKADSKSNKFERQDLLKIVKDSDLLDRIRTNDLNEKYIRYEETKQLIEFAKVLVKETLNVINDN